ncbi:metal dependent phosphohydrolase [Thermovirga lienii DSM 17291]|uniref:Metal dependent phosphohydrolase n=1 Tax=Thermovirga lienii (strain ATCC BAA-1197 / DSM 17291 / Cas60314) TaxID=580340 RepID=G7V9K2_THELD|nr:HD domain-containing protein [Thermovirga lienii]AER66552.1 metal dependent phosphohydrolase [Thermovirga lienii DSM 17291]
MEHKDIKKVMDLASPVSNLPKTRNIGDIKNLEPGERFRAVVALTAAKQRRDKNDRIFWEVSVMDSFGNLEAKVWSDAKWWNAKNGNKEPMVAENINPQEDLLNKPVGVIGVVTEFKGRLQYNFNEVYLLDPGKHPISSFLQKSPVPLAEMEKNFWSIVEKCGDPVKGFLHFVFRGDLWETFRDAPAAVSHHHAYVHGLLEHTLAVASSAIAIGESYVARDFPVDMDTLIAGALLHDLGKVEAYSLEPFPSMTLKGTVIDHIPLGYARFINLASEYDLCEDVTLAVGHIIISHHGRKEYGSPVLPATPEALIVSMADELDFILHCWEATGVQGDGEITDFSYSAQRRFWKRSATKDKKGE